MLSGTTPSAWAMAGAAVLRMVVSSDSMKNATATSQGRNFRLRLSAGGDDVGGWDLVVSMRAQGELYTSRQAHLAMGDLLLEKAAARPTLLGRNTSWAASRRKAALMRPR